MYSAQSQDYLQFQYQSQCEENTIDRNTPDSSDGIGSSVSSSPITSESNSRSISPQNEQNKQMYSSFNFQNYYNQVPFSTNSNLNSQFPNYQESYYYNYNLSQQNNQQKLFNNSSQFDDSNYYSRNNSILQSEHLNDSYSNYQKPNYQNNFALPSVPVKQEDTKKKIVLKFSIESILGLNSNKNETVKSPKKVENKIKQQLDLSVSNDESINEEPKTKNGKRKRSTRKSVESNKRIRTIFTQEQLDKLEIEFNRQQYMVGSERSYLANVLNLTESQVKIWFQNRRIKWRKANMGSNGNEKSNNDDYLNESYSNESFTDE